MKRVNPRRTERRLVLALLVLGPPLVDCTQPQPVIVTTPPAQVEITGQGGGGAVGTLRVTPPPGSPLPPILIGGFAPPAAGGESSLFVYTTALGGASAVVRNFGGPEGATADVGASVVTFASPVSPTATFDIRVEGSQFLSLDTTGPEALELAVNLSTLKLGPGAPSGAGELDLLAWAECRIGPNVVTGTALPVFRTGVDPAPPTSTLTFNVPDPSALTTVDCDFDLIEDSTVSDFGPQTFVHSANLTISKIRQIAPLPAPAQSGVISAVFIPAAQATTYTLTTSFPGPVTIQWSGAICGTFTDHADGTADWYHPHPPCDPTTGHQHVTIVALVSDGIDQLVCTYRGAASGVGPPCTEAP
jgi:hypothetical protein